jgi:hypothetical protein
VGAVRVGGGAEHVGLVDGFGPLLYARVDMAFLGDGMPAIMEVELIDPVLSLWAGTGAADRLAAAIAGRCHGG